MPGLDGNLTLEFSSAGERPSRARRGGEPPVLRDRQPVAVVQQLTIPPPTKLGSIDSDTPLAFVVHAHFRRGSGLKQRPETSRVLSRTSPRC